MAISAVASVLGWGVVVALNLVSTPFFLAKLGPEGYGVLALVMTVLNYVTLLDLGLNAAAIKFVAEDYARGALAWINQTLTLLLLVYCAGGLVGAIGLAFAAPILARDWLDLPEALQAPATIAFRLAGILFALKILSLAFVSIPQGLQRYDLSNLVTVGVTALGVVFSFGALAMGGDVRAVLAMLTVTAAFGLPVAWGVARRLLPSLGLEFHLPRRLFGRFFGFGFFAFVGRAAMVGYSQLDRLLIGVWLGATAVTFYAVPAMIAQAILAVGINVTQALFPLSSELAGSGQGERLEAIYRRATKVSITINTGLVVVVVALADELLRYWISPELAAQSQTALVALALGAWAMSLTLVPGMVLDGTGHPQVTAAFSAVAATLNAGGCLILIPALGILGAALTNGVVILLVPALLLVVQRRLFRGNVWGVVKAAYVRPLLAGLAFLLLVQWSGPLPVRSLTGVFAAGILGLGLYALLAMAFGVVDAEDRRLLSRLLPTR